jgi:hypothetical protein
VANCGLSDVHMCFARRLWLYIIPALYKLTATLNIQNTLVVLCDTSLTFNNSMFRPHNLFMSFVWIWEHTAIIFLYIIKRFRTCGYFRDMWLCYQYVSGEPYSSIFRVKQCSEQLHRTQLLWQLRLTGNGGGILLSKFRTSTKLWDATFCRRRSSKIITFLT